MKFCICITYCVKQRNRITIINENIVSRSRKYDLTVLHALLIRSCVSWWANCGFSFSSIHVICRDENRYITQKKKKKNNNAHRNGETIRRAFLSRRLSRNRARPGANDFYKRCNQALMIAARPDRSHPGSGGSIVRSIDRSLGRRRNATRCPS